MRTKPVPAGSNSLLFFKDGSVLKLLLLLMNNKRKNEPKPGFPEKPV